MIRPHHILDEGRIITFEPGPLEYHDLGDTIHHVKRIHELGRQRPILFAFVTAEQGYQLRGDARFQMARERVDPLMRRDGSIGTFWGVEIFVGDPFDYLRRRPRPQTDLRYLHPDDYARFGYGQVVTTATPNAARADAFYQTATEMAAKVPFGDRIFGKKFDAAWIDERKPADTTHENW